MASLAERTSGYLRALRIPILLLLAAVGLLAAYYSIYVTDRADYLTGRNMRLIGHLGRQVETALADHETVLASFSNYYRAERFVASFPCVARIARAYVPMFAYVTLAGGAAAVTADATACDGIATFARSDPPQAAPLAAPVVFVERDSGAAWARRTGPPPSSPNRFVIPIGEVVDPLFAAHAREGVFDTLLMATTSGRVMHQAPGSDLRLTSLNRLVQRLPDGTRKEIDFPALPLASQALDIELSGGRYKMYLQSCCTALTENAGAADRPGWLVAGLVANGTVRSESMAVSFSMMALIGAAILFAIFSWPFVKLALIGEGHRVRLMDVLLVGVCGLLAVSLLTAGAVDWLSYSNFKTQLDGELEKLSRSVRQKLALEIDRAAAQLDQLESVAGTGSGDRTPSMLAALSDPPYPFMESFALIDAGGMQTRKWAAAEFTTPRIATAHRDYFRYWMRPHPERPPYFLESIRSGTTGRKEAVLSRVSAQPGAAVASLTIPMLSVTEPLLPPGFGFAVIDENGAVLFHSDPEHSLDEQFFLETDRHRRLRAAVAARRGELVNVRYFGRDHRAYVAPVDVPEGARWSIVTFHDKEPVRTINIEWLLITLLLTVIYVGLYLAMSGAVLLWRPDYRAAWIWPDPSRTPAYQRLIVCYGALGLTFAGAIYALRDRSLLAVALLLPFIAWAATYIALTRRTSWTKRQPLLFAGAGLAAALLLYRAIGDLPGGAPLAAGVLLAFLGAAAGIGLAVPRPYRAAATMLLVVAAVLPSVAFFKVAHAIQVESFVKYAQLDLARAHQARMDRARHEASLLGPGSARVAAAMARLRDELTLYHGVFLGTEVTAGGAADGVCAPGDEQLGRSELPKRLEEMLPYYSESSVGMRELLHDGASDEAWQWRRTSAHLTLLARAQSGGEVICVRSTVPGILAGATEPGGGVYARAVLLGALVLAAAWWVAGFVARRVMLLDVIEPLWSRTDGIPAFPGTNLYVRRRDAERGERLAIADDARVIDVTGGLAAGDSATWLAAQRERLELVPPGARIVFDRLDAGSADAAFNRRKLALLQEALDVQHRTVVIVSSLTPASLARRIAEAAGAEGDATAATWTAVLARFTMIDAARFGAAGRRAAAAAGAGVGIDAGMTPDITPAAGSVDCLDLDDPVVRSVWDDVREAMRARQPGLALDHEQLLEEVGDRLERHYQGTWASCSDQEKRVLMHLADEGLVNEKDRKVIRVLLARGLVRRGPDFDFADPLFRRFVLCRTATPEAVALDRRSDSAWDHIRMPFMAAVIGISAFFFLTQRELFTTTMAVITALAGGIPAAVRVIGLFERKPGQPLP